MENGFPPIRSSHYRVHLVATIFLHCVGCIKIQLAIDGIAAGPGAPWGDHGSTMALWRKMCPLFFFSMVMLGLTSMKPRLLTVVLFLVLVLRNPLSWVYMCGCRSKPRNVVVAWVKLMLMKLSVSQMLTGASKNQIQAVHSSTPLTSSLAQDADAINHFAAVEWACRNH